MLKLIRQIFRPTTDLVLSDFAKLETKLARVMDQQNAKCAKATAQAAALQAQAAVATDEANRALRVSTKIKELLA